MLHNWMHFDYRFSARFPSRLYRKFYAEMKFSKTRKKNSLRQTRLSRDKNHPRRDDCRSFSEMSDPNSLEELPVCVYLGTRELQGTQRKGVLIGRLAASTLRTSPCTLRALNSNPDNIPSSRCVCCQPLRSFNLVYYQQRFEAAMLIVMNYFSFRVFAVTLAFVFSFFRHIVYLIYGICGFILFTILIPVIELIIELGS